MINILKSAKDAARELALLSEAQRNEILLRAAELLTAHEGEILAANARDLEAASALSEAMKDRLALTPARIFAMAEGCRKVAAQPAVIGAEIERRELENGLLLRRISVPLGVVGIIYEARPNVTADAFALAIKSANAVVLKGGSEALNSNKLIASLCALACEQIAGLKGAVGFVADASREASAQLMKAGEYIDVLIPRGGAGLIAAVRENARVPVIATGVGNCHVYIERSADLALALRVLQNAKLSRTSVCNAAECVLIDEAIAEEFCSRLRSWTGVEFRGCERASELLGCAQAGEDEWFSEYLAPILRVKIVRGTDEAISHIARYGSGHSEAICTQGEAAWQAFSARVDAACVYRNASTRFSDGECFGLGAEIGISTQKMHARGPMGAAALTSYKYVIEGSGQVRK